MRNSSKLEAPLNANAFHPLFGMSFARGAAKICASATVKEHLISHERTIAIATAPIPRIMSRITGA
jgi:hypothetical protein